MKTLYNAIIKKVNAFYHLYIEAMTTYGEAICNGHGLVGA